MFLSPVRPCRYLCLTDDEKAGHKVECSDIYECVGPWAEEGSDGHHYTSVCDDRREGAGFDDYECIEKTESWLKDSDYCKGDSDAWIYQNYVIEEESEGGDEET